MLSVFVIKNMIGCDWMVWMYLYDVYVCMYRMTNGRLEVRIFFFNRSIPMPVEVISLMLILRNYRLKHLKHENLRNLFQLFFQL